MVFNNNKKKEIKYMGECPSSSYDSAGHDVGVAENTILEEHNRPQTILLNMRLRPPKNIWTMVTGRSGLNKSGVFVCPGVIDNDYTGPLSAVIYNFSGESMKFNKGDKIAQVLFFSQINPQWINVNEQGFKTTKRGEKGFGSESIFNKAKRYIKNQKK